MKLTNMLIVLFVVAMLVAACGPSEPEVVEKEVTRVVKETVVETVIVEVEVKTETEAGAEAGAEEPTELTMVAISPNTAEDPWPQALMQSADRVIEEKYRGLDMNFEYVENVQFPDVERVGREYAKSGEVDILWFHTSYLDAVSVLREEFPDQLISITSSVYDDHKAGSNQYWMNAGPVLESSYLGGVLAGLMTESNTVGVVAAYPVDSQTMPMNAYIDGVRSVNPDAEVKVSFIESWYDPAKAREAAETQINAGTDVLFSIVFGPFEAATKHPGVSGIGFLIDQIYLAPEVVLTSPIAKWDPRIKFLIDEWWEHKVNGTPYSSPAEAIQFTMADGGNEIGPINEDLVPQEFIDQVMDIRQQILDGELVVQARFEIPESD